MNKSPTIYKKLNLCTKIEKDLQQIIHQKKKNKIKEKNIKSLKIEIPELNKMKYNNDVYTQESPKICHTVQEHYY